MVTLRFQGDGGAFCRYAGPYIPDGVADGQCARVTEEAAAYLLASFGAYFSRVDGEPQKASLDAPEAASVMPAPARRGRAK